MIKSDKILLRSGTAASWSATNPKLELGEIGYEIDTRKIKVGDGEYKWNGLSYIYTGDANAAGTSGQVQFNNGGLLGTNANFFWDNAQSFLGIGTASPLARLNVSSSVNSVIEPVLGAATNSVAIFANSANAYGLNIVTSGSGVVYLQNQRFDTLTTTYPLIINGYGGNVGIGVTNPSQTLHVSGNVRVTGAYYDSNNSAGTSGQILASTGTGTDWVTLSEITGVDGSGTLNYLSKWTPDGNTIGNSQIFDNGTNIGIGTTSPTYKLDVTGTGINTTDIYSRNFYQTRNGVPRANLGNPTVTEMALFQEQFDNKLAFYPPANITYETFDGTTWTETVLTDTVKKNLVGGDTGTAINIPYGTQKVRFTIRNKNSYVNINTLYMYFSGQGHSTQIHIWSKHDSGSWVQNTDSTQLVAGWPAHVYLPFNGLWWLLGGTLGTHVNDVRIELTPTWNATYPANGIQIYRMQLWGGYPAAKRTVFSVDADQNVNFPGQIGVGNNPNKAVITYTTNAQRIFTIPSTTGDRTFAFIDQPQTISAAQTFTATSNWFRHRIGIGDGNGTPYTDSGSPGVWLSYNGAQNAFMGMYSATTWGAFVNGDWRLVATSTGNVGIGVQAPTTRLEIGGTFRNNTDDSAFSFDAGNNDRLGIIKKFGSNPVIASGSGQPIIFSQSNQARIIDNISTATLTEYMRIASGGNVGIGITNPSVNLHVYGGGNESALFENSNSNETQIGLKSPTRRYHLVVAGASPTVGLPASSFAIRDYSAGVNRLVIDSSGNVGVGTTSPTVKLDIAGTAEIKDGINAQAFRVYNTYTDGSNYERAKFVWSSNVLQIGTEKLGTGVARALALQTDGTNRILISTTGNVGINASSIRGRLDVYGLDSEVFIGNDDSQSLVIGNSRRLNYGDLLIAKNLAGVAASDSYRTVFNSAATGYCGIELRYPGDIAFYGQNGATTGGATVTPTNRMMIKGDTGNIGINTASPGSTLDVKGTLRLSGATSGYVGLAPASAAGSTTYTLPSADGTSGQFLRTNGSGTLSWASASAATIYSPTTTTTITELSGEVVVLADATSGSLTVNLPTAVSNTAKITVKKIDSSINTVVIDGNSTQTIDGSLTKTIEFQYTSVTLISNGSNWFII